MPNEVQEGETPEVKPVEKQVEEAKTETVEEHVEASADELARKLKNKEEEAARLHKKVEKFEADEVERKKAAMSETERLQAELADAQRRADELATKQAQRDAAEKVGLPAVFAERIKGATPEEMEADAKLLLDNMPKAKQKPIGGMSPAEAEQKGLTDDDRRKFLYG